jgi:hypothetical protein
LILQGVSIFDQANGHAHAMWVSVIAAAREIFLAGPAADALQNWGILVVGRRRLTPVQLRQLRVDVPGEKAKV